MNSIHPDGRVVQQKERERESESCAYAKAAKKRSRQVYISTRDVEPHTACDVYRVCTVFTRFSIHGYERTRERVWQIENVSIFTQRNDESTDFIYSMHTHSPKHVYTEMYSKHDINGSVRSCTYYLHYTSIQLLHVLPEMC